MSETAVVPVKPALESKINWTQVAGIAASVAAIFGLDVDPTTLVAVVVGIQGVVSLVTVIMRTWFNKSVTPASLGR